jgi:hypothetical protein
MKNRATPTGLVVRVLALGCTAWIATFVALMPGDAEATHRRMSFMTCQPNPFAVGDLQFNTYLENISTGIAYAYCYAPSDSLMTHSQVTTLNLHGFQQSGSSNTATACSKSFDSSAGSCGPTSTWSDGYAGVYGVNLVRWGSSYSSRFPYIFVGLDVGGRLHGYYIEG